MLFVKMNFTATGTAYKFFTHHTAKTPTLIFIHGVGLKGDVWQPQVEYFSKEYQIITYDLLGHGESPLPSKKTNEKLSLNDYVEQLSSLVKHLHLSSFFFVGHSMGSIISMAFALKYPNKVNAFISMNMVFNRSAQAAKIALERAKKILDYGHQSIIKETLNRWFPIPKNTCDRQKIAKIKTWLENTPQKGYAETYLLFASSDKTFLTQFSKLSMPVLYLTGDKDLHSTTAMSREMAKLTPNGKSIAIADEAHMMAYISADKVNPILEKFFIAPGGDYFGGDC